MTNSMRVLLKALDLERSVVARAGSVVDFDASDLPEPGAGFEELFRELNKTRGVGLSQDRFDAEVVLAYSRRADA